jgi:hypothetical protein
MIQLEPEQIHNTEGLFLPFMHLLVVPAVLRGHAPARCWSDGAESPSFAVMWDLVNGFVFCAGDASPHLGEFLLTELLPRVREDGYRFVDLHFASVTLLEETRQWLAGQSVSPKSLLLYSHSPKDGAIADRALRCLDGDVKLARITEGILSSDLVNMDEISRCIKACWRDQARYLEEGIGYCLIHGADVASWCSTDYVMDGSADLYVETFGSYQGRGMAACVASACVDACLSAGWVVHWHCWSSSLGSRRVAEKIGLKLKSTTQALRVRAPDGPSVS